jgi:hypothetical protein
MPRFRARRAVAAVVGAAALVAVTAFPAGAKTSTPEKWGAAFCGGLSEWADKITTGGAEISSSVSTGTTPTAGKAIIVGYIGDIGDATNAFFTAVKKAGAPDTTNGTKIQKEILKGISGIETRVGDMEDLASNLPTTDPASFQTAVTALSSSFDTVSVPFDNAMDKVSSLDKDDDLSDSLQKVKECKALF